jgi:hypothetical protein
MTGEAEFDSPQTTDFSLSSTASRPDFGATQSTIQGVRGGSFPEVRRPGREAGHTIHLVPRLRTRGDSPTACPGLLDNCVSISRPGWTGSERKRALLRHSLCLLKNYARWKEFRIIILSAGIFTPCIWWKFPEERTAYIVLGLLFDLEYECSSLPRNVGKLMSHYTAYVTLP